jgi:hypothetical protein
VVPSIRLLSCFTFLETGLSWSITQGRDSISGVMPNFSNSSMAPVIRPGASQAAAEVTAAEADHFRTTILGQPGVIALLGAIGDK